MLAQIGGDGTLAIQQLRLIILELESCQMAAQSEQKFGSCQLKIYAVDLQTIKIFLL